MSLSNVDLQIRGSIPKSFVYSVRKRDNKKRKEIRTQSGGLRVIVESLSLKFRLSENLVRFPTYNQGQNFWNGQRTYGVRRIQGSVWYVGYHLRDPFPCDTKLRLKRIPVFH